MATIQVWKVQYGGMESREFAGTLQQVIDKAFVYQEKVFEKYSKKDARELSKDFKITEVRLIAEGEE